MKRYSRNLKGLLLPVCIGFGLFSLNASASAQISFHVNLDTSSIAGGLYNIELYLADGQVANSMSPDGNNTVTVNNFNLGGGTAGAILPPTMGGASGTISGGFTLVDNMSDQADIAQGFTAGSSLQFDVQSSTNMDASGTPDNFLIRILNFDGSAYIPSADPVTGTAIVNVNLSSSTTPIGIFPLVVTTVPEPGSLALLLGSIGSGSVFVRRRYRRR